MRMKVQKDESGQVLVLTLLCMMVLFGFLALAIDVGLLFRAKRNLQIAADAAATAAALDYYFDNNVASAESVGTQAATDNGITAATGGPTVTFNTGANITTPYHQGTGYFEAVLTQPNPTVFGGYLGIGSVNIYARAVAGTPGAAQGCVYVMDPSGACPAMTLQGSFNVNAQKCAVEVEGTCDDALQFTGGAGTLTAGSVSVVGGDGGHPSDSTPTPVTGVAPVTNPLQAIVPPTPSGCSAGGTLTGNSARPGVQCATAGNVTLSNAVISGTLVFTGNVTLWLLQRNDRGERRYHRSQQRNPTDSVGTAINLTAPTTGTYAGIVLMAPVTNTSTITFEFGNTHGTLYGIIDVPGANLYLHDSGGDHSGGLVLTTDLVVGTLDDQTAELHHLQLESGQSHHNSPEGSFAGRVVRRIRHDRCTRFASTNQESGESRRSRAGARGTRADDAAADSVPGGGSRIW